jgi:hypothetical protein
MAFKNYRTLVSDVTGGNYTIGQYRKAVSAAATVTGQWFDYSYTPGMPVANYYAASPTTSAVLDTEKGLYHPTLPAKQVYLKSWCAMSLASSGTSTTNQNQHLILCDYLLYYPFVDADAAGDLQTMTNTVGLPRYTTDKCLQMMVVSQSATTGGGSFTVTYLNQDGVEKTTPTVYCAAAQSSGALVSCIGNATSTAPFVPLADGDTGVTQVKSVTMIANNGGLFCIVIVKPLLNNWIREEVRRRDATTFASYGDAALVESGILNAGYPEIKDGAFLGIIGRGMGGSLASSVLCGYIEYIWSN